jgi:hypothetical protein
VVVNFVVTTLTVILQIPSIFNIPLNLTLAIVLLIFSDHLIGNSWPDSPARRGYEGNYKVFCQPRWVGPGDIRVDPDCEHAREVIKALMGVSAGIGIWIA